MFSIAIIFKYIILISFKTLSLTSYDDSRSKLKIRDNTIEVIDY